MSYARTVHIMVFTAFTVAACSAGQAVPLITSPAPDMETIDEYFARCPTIQEVARVNADLKVSFEYDPADGNLVCDSPGLTALQKRAYQTIYLMRVLKFSQPLPWTDRQLYDWFVDAIDGLRFVNGGISRCCEPADIVVIAVTPDSPLLQADKPVTDSEGSGLMNVMLLYAHEARHNEGYQHTCTTRSGDDNTLDEMGAWSIQYYLALWVAEYADPGFMGSSKDGTDHYRRLMLEHSRITFLTRFCKEKYSGQADRSAPSAR